MECLRWVAMNSAIQSCSIRTLSSWKIAAKAQSNFAITFDPAHDRVRFEGATTAIQ